MRNNSQKIHWTPALLSMGASMGGTSLAYQMKAPTWNLAELFKQFDTDHDGYLSM